VADVMAEFKSLFEKLSAVVELSLELMRSLPPLHQHCLLHLEHPIHALRQGSQYAQVVKLSMWRYRECIC